jgi:hypothetical protein
LKTDEDCSQLFVVFISTFLLSHAGGNNGVRCTGDSLLFVSSSENVSSPLSTELRSIDE